MNQLTFWLGFFAGCTSLTILLLAWLHWIKSSSVTSEEVRTYHDTTIRLMAERNDTDRRIAEALQTIADRNNP